MSDVNLTKDQAKPNLIEFNEDWIKDQLNSFEEKLDGQAKFSRNIIIGVAVAAFLILFTVAVEVVLFHSNGVSEEEYINALNEQEKYLELLIDSKISEIKAEQSAGARDTIQLESEI